MKNLVTFVTFFPLILGFILAIVWWSTEKDFEPLLTTLGLLATITGIFGERWATANEKRTELLRALLNERSSNAEILADSRFQASYHRLGRPLVFPRLIMSVNETAIASGVFAEGQDSELFLLLHQWRHTVNEFNRRLDITELRTFTNLSSPEILSLYEALQESKEFHDAVTLNEHITDVLKSKYPKATVLLRP
ncbi:hypothetical protein [Nostoc parmelioides]|uniref:Uncharacterized protein n=1 Tax=Nostoc parmelioides FACHB-3921 TaxID=2692909 RepID=A0ABR8BCI6_9NOSO|nr:hypothetical protein [Nostoc parmelioides]MBD2251792.1 hypothetical protein [Nostoc parmelioides FACHB-3921]